MPLPPRPAAVASQTCAGSMLGDIRVRTAVAVATLARFGGQDFSVVIRPGPVARPYVPTSVPSNMRDSVAHQARLLEEKTAGVAIGSTV